MFVLLLHYKKPLDEIDERLTAHREFLEEGYKNNYFLDNSEIFSNNLVFLIFNSATSFFIFS